MAVEGTTAMAQRDDEISTESLRDSPFKPKKKRPIASGEIRKKYDDEGRESLRRKPD